MTSGVAVILLCLVALLFTVVAPRLMATQVRFRTCPGPALLVWQGVALAGVLAALLAAPVAVVSLTPSNSILIGVAVALSATMLGRLLLSAHQVGTGLRALRRRHVDWVELLAGEDHATGAKVLAYPGPTAYCIPGHRRQVVLSEGALRALEPEELSAVLAHERAHLGARHDLILEFFSVLHHAVPRRMRCDAALIEVRLLVEALADRAALRHCGPMPLARALVRMQRAPESPVEDTRGSASGLVRDHAADAKLGAISGTEQARVRLMLVADAATPRHGQAVGMVAFACGVVATPFVLAAVGV